MQEYKIEVQKRDINNRKSTIRELRKIDKVPGVYYSHNSKLSIPFSIDKKMLYSALRSDASVYKISVGGKDRDVIIKSLQYHPISEDILHIDLYGVKMDTKITLKVPIVFVGQAEGVRAGGVLNQTLTELEISCLPSHIPQNIEVDVTHLNIGDTIRLDQVTLDETLELIGDKELLIASITLPTKEEEPEEVLEDTEEIIDGEESTEDSPNASSENVDEEASE